ncbi:MAG: phosphodiesterase [Acinetobacter sp.]|uniref:phosphodiesterase n=1 Tax=Acinetobacter sp. TaxID=472 RepID=UPI002649F80B|nr:phosphodiesterase [Acinetobacter sp.]MDN5513194.1 phosphodiesterase [Acinetobacter sp.]MDN5556862.1 phosphodiesterase [Acinetobacter sp.]
MIILSHRGYWNQVHEKNTAAAFTHSFNLGFGTETDIRDQNGILVISHDIPSNEYLTFNEFLNLCGKRDLPLALNIKADGLASILKENMQNIEHSNWFVFDMSIPDMRAYLNQGIPVFTRMSEVEQQPVWLDQAVGVWLDSFSVEWYDTNLVEELLLQGKKVCVVSSELHGRDKTSLWRLLYPLSHHAQLMLCTDTPEEAKGYFDRAKK